MVERAGQQVELTLIPDSRELSQGKVIGFAGIAPKSQNGRKTIDLNCNLVYLSRLVKRLKKRTSD